MTTHRKPRMLAIGTATQDVFLRSKQFKPHRQEGKYYEQFLLGAKLAIDEVTFATGGNAMNAAVTFARQGLESEFMGILGVEPAGQVVMNALDSEGIATHHVVQDEQFQTSYSTILLAPSGERTILNYHGTHVHDSGAPLDLSAIEHADWLYLSSVGSVTLLEKLVTRAAKAGVQVALNPSGAELAEADKLRTVLEDVAVLLVNKEEMKQLVEGETLEELVRHGANLVRTVVVSDGPNGVMATDSTKIVKAGMYEDVPVVDRTGAGDAFGSGFVAWHAAGKSLEDAITFASANATGVVTQVGATAGILHAHAQLHDMPLRIKDF
jgi:sugar/nucleoside kinase (ribokinase family)